MKYKHKSHKVFLSYTLVILWLFIVTLILIPLYKNLIIDIENRTSKNIELKKQESRLQELQEIRTIMQNPDNEIVDIISLFSKKFHEYEVFEYLHDYTRTIPWNRILIREISFVGPTESDIWFQRTQVQLSFIAASEEALFNFMNFLTSSDYDYRFFIPSFNYALGEVEGNFIAQVPLILYHR